MNSEEKIMSILEKVSDRIDRIADDQKAMNNRMDAFDSRFDQMDRRMDAFDSRMGALQGDVTQLSGRVDRLDRRMDALQDNILQAVRIEIETKVTRELRLLAEGHADIIDRLKRLSVIDSMQDDISTLKAAVKYLSGEIEQLKRV